jgi:thymidylate synthase (FAD)
LKTIAARIHSSHGESYGKTVGDYFLRVVEASDGQAETLRTLDPDAVEVVECRPEAWLIAKTMIDREQVEKFLNAETDGEWLPRLHARNEAGIDFLPEFAGRLCYMSFDGKGRKTNKEYLDHIREVGHGSVLEHSNLTVLFTGVSRSLSHELVRHRAGFAYSQLSQRYVGEEHVRFVVPDGVRAKPESYTVWRQAVGVCLHAYRQLTEQLSDLYKDVEDKTMRKKMARQEARSVLPNSTETKVVVTANARAWRHFLEMRASKPADTEIRRVAVEAHRLLVSAAPNLFGDYRAVPCEGGDALETATKKV